MNWFTFLIVGFVLVTLLIFYGFKKDFLFSSLLKNNNKPLEVTLIIIFNFLFILISVYILFFFSSIIATMLNNTFGLDLPVTDISGDAETYANLLTILTIISALIFSKFNKEEQDGKLEELLKDFHTSEKEHIKLLESINEVDIIDKIDSNNKTLLTTLTSITESNNSQKKLLDSSIENQKNISSLLSYEQRYKDTILNTNLILGLIKDNHEIFYSIHDDIDNLVNTIQTKISFGHQQYIYIKKETTKHITDEVKTELKDFLNNELSDKRDSQREKHIKRILKDVENNNYEMLISLYLYKIHELDCNLAIPFYLDKSGDLYKYIDEFYDHLNKLVFTSKLQNINTSFKTFYDAEFTKKYDNFFTICTKEFKKQYNTIGHFYRHVHRIIKIINETDTTLEIDKNKFLGILRAQLSEKVLISIYYNCVYTERGYGMGKQLVGTDFFGTLSDFKAREPIHFSKEFLLVENKDISILKDIFTKESCSNHELFVHDYEKQIRKVYQNIG